MKFFVKIFKSVSGDMQTITRKYSKHPIHSIIEFHSKDRNKRYD